MRPLGFAGTLPGVLISVLCSVGCSGLAGCGALQSARGVQQGAALRGHVLGGQQPVGNALIQMYAVSSAGDGTASTSLLSGSVRTDASGMFSITGTYTCPSASTFVYLTATGGNPGLATGVNNTSSALMLGLGECGTLTPATFLEINEVTTVASVWSLASFMKSYAAVGAGSSDAQQLGAAFHLIQVLVNASTGAVDGPGLPAGYSLPVAMINTWANVLASCVNTAGGVAGDGSACGNLFVLTTPQGGTAPTETIGAALEMAENPTLNVGGLFDLAHAQGPFQPSLATAPPDWSITISPSTPGGIPQQSTLLGEYLLNEAQGTVAHDTSGNGNDAAIVGASWEGAADLNFTALGQYIQVPTALNQANTWQFALYSPPFGYAVFPQPPGYGQPVGFGANPSILCGNDTAHTCLAPTSFFRPLSQRFYAFQSNGTEASSALSAGWHIVTLVGGQGGALDHYYYDGVEVNGYVHQGSGLFSHPASGNYQIGGSSQYTGTWFLGKVAAAWAWSSSLSATDALAAAQSAMSYIQVKGAAPNYSPLVHAQPLIIGSLDSRTYGAGTSQVWINNLVLDKTGYTTLNLGFPGATAYDTLAMYDMLHAPQVQGNTAPTIEVFWGAVNDFASNSSMTTQIIANSLQGLVQKAKSLGARVVLATEISSNSGANGDAGKDALDPVIRGQAFTWGVDNIADLATVPQLGADGAYADATYFSSDGLHPTDAGEVYVTGIMSNAINELNGSTATSPNTTALGAYQETAGDRYLDLTSATAQTVTLPNCLGYSLSRSILNLGQSVATIAAVSGQVLNGSNSVAPGTTAIFTPVPGPVSTGGCSWQRTS